MNTQLNYHHLRYFAAVAAEGGIKAAAQTLHLSSPTLSAQIRVLEEFLGTPLFVRTGKKLVLTDTGRIAQRYAERVLGLGDELVETVRRGTPTGPETVHVGLVDAVPKLLASAILVRAWEESPSLRIVVREGLPGELFPSLTGHQLDIVISNEPAPASQRPVLFSRRVARYGVHFMAAASLAARYRPRTGLDGFPLLLPTRESPLRRELDRWFADHGLRPEIRAEFDDVAAMCEMASAGAGAAPLPSPMLATAKQRYGLRPLPARLGVREDLFIVTAERQFTHEGPRILSRAAGEIGRGAK